MRTSRNFIDGSWLNPPQATIAVEDPSTGTVVGAVPDSSAAEVDEAVTAARRAFDEGPWPRMTAADRAECLRSVAAVLESRFDAIVSGLVADTGCTVRLCPMLQAGSPLAHLRDFAEMAPMLDEPRAYPVQNTPAFGQWELHRQPIGVVAGFVPYNFPLFIAVWKAAPALLAGNTVVLKPSPLTPFGVDELVSACAEAGVPPGVINVVHGDRVAGEALVEHRDVDMVSFTGSTGVGRLVMRSAADTAKDVVMELGGKSPAIVLPDANAEFTARGVLFSSMMHSGQACVATTRILVPESRYEEFRDLLALRANQLSVGAADDYETDVGPVITAAALDKAEKAVARAVEQGGSIIAGGGRPDGVPGGGHYLSPTVLDVEHDNFAAQEEIFGPVLAMVTYRDVDEAVRMANDTDYGLAASVWATDLQRARQVAGRLQSGLTWINDTAAADVARTPFAGRKQSGVGTELGPDGLYAYTKVKSLYTGLDQDLDSRPYGAVGSSWE